MRSEINHFEKGQIWILLDGNIVMITNVDEATKLHNSEDDRRCQCVIGHRHKKNEQFKNHDIVVVENAPINSIISFDVSAGKSYTMSELRRLEAGFIGKLTAEKSREFNGKLASYYERLD